MMIFDGSIEQRKQIGIYAIENLCDGMRYIGQTTESFERRYWHHQHTLTHNTNSNAALQAAWNRDGPDSFAFRVLQTLDASEDFDAAEKAAISEARGCHGAYNVSDGGAGKASPMSEHAKQIVGEKNRQHMLGRKASEETKAKMRASSHHHSPSAAHRQAISDYMRNRAVSAETRAKVSAAYSGENSRTAKINNEQAAAIRRKYMDGQTIMAISREMGVSYGIVCDVVHNATFQNVVVDGWTEYCDSRQNAKERTK